MFRSFVQAGFECATGFNRKNEWFDQIAATQHDSQVEADYRRLARLGILTVREGVRWPLVDLHGRYDFSSLDPFLAAAGHQGIEVIWDLFHYGYPIDLDPFAPQFVARFADYCAAAARHICSRSRGPWYFTPVNEPSYFAWAAGESALFAPHMHGRAPELKKALVRSAIRGIDAIRVVCPGARMVNADPICRVAVPLGREDLTAGALHFNHSAVYEAWDMLCGALHPELGGSRSHLDIVGINYYRKNQWEIGNEDLALSEEDPRRAPLSELVRDVWRRYGGEMMISETSDVGTGRAAWLETIGDEVAALQNDGVSLVGVCWYPVLGMPEWHERDRWTNMGLWDLHQRGTVLVRVPAEPVLASLQAVQERLTSHNDGFPGLLQPSLDRD